MPSPCSKWPDFPETVIRVYCVIHGTVVELETLGVPCLLREGPASAEMVRWKLVRKGSGLRAHAARKPLFNQSAQYHVLVRSKVCEEKGGA